MRALSWCCCSRSISLTISNLSRRRLRGKIPQLQLALAGKVREHHRFLLQEFLDEWKALQERVARVEMEIDRRIVLLNTRLRGGKPFPARTT